MKRKRKENITWKSVDLQKISHLFSCVCYICVPQAVPYTESLSVARQASCVNVLAQKGGAEYRYSVEGWQWGKGWGTQVRGAAQGLWPT